MKSVMWKQILDKSDTGYARLKITYSQDKPVDFQFMDVNASFEKITKISRRNLVKRKGSAIFADSFDELSLWRQFCEVANTKNSKEYEGYSSLFQINYLIKICSLKKDQIVLLLKEINSSEIPLLEQSDKESFLGNYLKNMVWIIGMDFQITYVSPSVGSVLGYSAVEMLSKSVFNIVSSTSIDSFMTVFEVDADNPQIGDDNEILTMEVEMINKAGNIILTEQLIQYLHDISGKITSIIANVRDITERKMEKEKVIRSEERLRMILDSTAEAIFGISLVGTITFCNNSCLGMLGYTHQNELLGKNAHKLFHNRNVFNQIIPPEQCEILKTLKTGVGIRVDDDVFWKKDGTSIQIEYYAYPQFHDNKIEGAVITFFDISAQLKIERDLKESIRSKSVILANLPGMAYKCLFDRQWTMQFVSDGCFALTEYRPESLLNNRDLSFNDLIAPEYREHLWRVWGEAAKNRTPIREEYIIITASGKHKWVLEQGQALYNETGEVEALEGLILDISDQKIKQLEIQYMSQHDLLTGLFNRAYFEKEKDRLDNFKYLPLSIIIGDINGLKLTNDAFGHDEGDRLIQRTASLITGCVRENDIVARTGGDEFTILLPNTDSETAYYYLKKIQAQCKRGKDKLAMGNNFISLSLGFATKESPEENIIGVQKYAEDFMYKRKLLERNSIHNSFLSSITATMFEKSQETEEHAERMRTLSVQMGTKLGFNQKDLDELALLATLHDIGKVSIDRNILNKPGKLTPEEWLEIKKHPEIGYRITKASSELATIAEYVLSHHERWDGKGYPQGLKETHIPIQSRIIGIVDAYDAMTNERPYRPARSSAEAIAEIQLNSGTQFDPNLAGIFVDLIQDSQNKVS